VKLPQVTDCIYSFFPALYLYGLELEINSADAINKRSIPSHPARLSVYDV